MTLNSPEPLAWLAGWYQSHCDGDWEHQNGIRIGTLDNPGWWLDVDLGETKHAGRVRSQELIQRSENDWVFLEVKDNRFRARGGPGNLAELIGLFATFVEQGSE
jgi:hypothetical protein